MEKEILYIGFYDVPDSQEKRVCCPAAIDKMDYISDALNRAGYSVHHISPSWCAASDGPWTWQKTIRLKGQKRLTLCPSGGARRKWLRNGTIVFALLWLLFYLIWHVRRQEKVLVYHSPWLSLPVRWAKRIKGFHLILEVEEIYGHVSSLHPCFDLLEYRLLHSADAYLFATDLLAERFGRSKPHCVVYGSYGVKDVVSKPANDGRIHLLYAGIVDSHKRGAFNAVESTRHLSGKYVLHVIGFGDTATLAERISELNRAGECEIVFDGTKAGVDYLRYAQSCHIGLATQSMNGEYLESSFPSKILSYLSMGLQVVSCHIECVAKSPIAAIVTFYYEDTPKAIAEAIQAVGAPEPSDSRLLLSQLDRRFTEDITRLVGP